MYVSEMKRSGLGEPSGLRDHLICEVPTSVPTLRGWPMGAAADNPEAPPSAFWAGIGCTVSFLPCGSLLLLLVILQLKTLLLCPELRSGAAGRF